VLLCGEDEGFFEAGTEFGVGVFEFVGHKKLSSCQLSALKSYDFSPRRMTR
jgi:hypothetical protein